MTTRNVPTGTDHAGTGTGTAGTGTAGTVPAASLLWYTDRSRITLGTARCACARYLGYHFGPTGYGITLKAESVPLSTGLTVHAGLEGFAGILRDHDRLPDLAETRAIIASVRADYETSVAARGFRGILAGPLTDEIAAEQSTLISGLLWALRLKFLPWLHETYQVVSVETERLHVLSCTCGAGPLDLPQHIARGCAGRVLMLRTDLLARRRTGTTLAYIEAKTTGWDSEAWAEQWEDNPQLGLGTLDTAEEYGAEVAELYILALAKGARRRDKADGEGGRKKQQSALCYGYCRPGSPPVMSDDWLPAYEWIDDTGQTKRASRAHRRRGVWTLGESDWPSWRAYQATDPALTPEEFWVRFLPPSVLDKICYLLGPMNRQDAQIQSLRRSIDAEEARWQEKLWRLYEAEQAGLRWPDDAFQALVDREIGRSWACRPFGKEHQCEFYGLCHREVGWDDPLGSGRYQPRLPHHQAELDAAVARGLLLAEAAPAAEAEERA